MPEKCPYCGGYSLIKQKPPAGDALFIGSIDSKTKSIFAADGIFCDFYMCGSCGNIQLRAKAK